MHMFKTLKFENNSSRFKFSGLKANWVCKACYDNINEAKMNAYSNYKNFGNPAMSRTSHHSVCQEELKEWFDKIQEFSKRKDIKDLILPHLDERIVFVCDWF